MKRLEPSAIRRSHRKMRQRLETLDHFLRDHEDRPGHHHHHEMKPCGLRKRVNSLLIACQECYELEEQGFLSVRRQRDNPRAALRFDSLLAEHRRILVALQAIEAACEVYCEEDQAPGPRLLQWARGTVNRAERHEDKEEALFQELLYAEHGGQS